MSDAEDWPRCYEIIPRLYLSQYKVAENIGQLKALGITHILNVTKDNPPTTATKQEANVLYHPIEDSPEQDLLEVFNLSFNFIQSALGGENDSQRVLVHCSAGQSRSAILVMHYLMRSQIWTAKHTWEFLKTKKPDVNPNFGFIRQLAAVEEQLTGQETLDWRVYLAEQICGMLGLENRERVQEILDQSKYDISQAMARLL